MLTYHNIRDLNLAETLDCGQSFRWTLQPNGSFEGIAFGKSVNVRLNGDTLFIDRADEADRGLWHDYFDLELDYAKIRSEYAALHPVIAEAVKYAPGIRILQQEPFEALCSFIISQNNNIKRIKGIVQRLCETFGDRLPNGAFAFPSAKTLSRFTAEALTPLRAGFRSRYIIDAAQKVASGAVDLERCRTAPYADARAELMKITGVGVKVADCTLLFGLHRLEAFPMDVWMKRAMENLFPDMTASDFGEYAGVVQQYIFHYSRMNPKIFDK